MAIAFSNGIFHSNVTRFSTDAQVASNIAEALQGIAEAFRSDPANRSYLGGVVDRKDIAEWLRQHPVELPPGLINKLQDFGVVVNDLYMILNKTPNTDSKGADPLSPPTPQPSVEPPAGGGVVT